MTTIFGQMDLGSIFGEEFNFPDQPAEEKKPAVKKSGKNASGKGKNTTMHVTLPCTIYGGSFKTLLKPLEGESETIDGTELLKRLLEAGMPEVITSCRGLFIPEDYASVAYIVAKQGGYMPGDDTLIQFEKDGVVFAYGEQKITYRETDFEGMDPDEIDLACITEEITGSFPHFKGMRMGYDIEAGVITPTLEDTAVGKSEKLPLPVTINSNGSEITVSESEAGGNTAGDVVSFLSREYAHPDLTAELVEQEPGYYFLRLRSNKNTSVSTEDFKKNKGTKTKKKEEKYPSDCTVYLSFSGYEENLSPEKFGGKKKITKTELLEYLKGRSSILRNPEKQDKTSCLYDEDLNRVCVCVTEGRRGTMGFPSARRYDKSWDYEETEHYNTPNGRDPMEDIILSQAELDIFLNTPSTCYDRPVGSRCENAGTRLFANKSMAYFYTCGVSRERTLVDVRMKVPKVPECVLKCMIGYFRSQLPNEAICRIMYDHRTKLFSMAVPKSVDATRTRVDSSFEPIRNPHKEIVATFHSHQAMPAYFSGMDDIAELEHIGIFGVIGLLDTSRPQIVIRAVCEGGVKPIRMPEFFEIG